MKNSTVTNISCETTPKTSPKISPRIINPLTYFKRPQKISKTSKFQAKSEVASPTDTNKKLLKKLSCRLTVKSLSISPEAAASVVKNYILPMFEYEKRLKTNIARSAMQKPKRQFSQDQATVYGEFKLSEKLAKELENLTIKLQKMEQNMKDNIQEKEITNKENAYLKQELHDNHINLAFYLNENQKLRRELSILSFSMNFSNSQLAKMHILYEDNIKYNEILVKQLNEERLLNDIRLFFI